MNQSFVTDIDLQSWKWAAIQPSHENEYLKDYAKKIIRVRSIRKSDKSRWQIGTVLRVRREARPSAAPRRGDHTVGTAAGRLRSTRRGNLWVISDIYYAINCFIFASKIIIL